MDRRRGWTLVVTNLSLGILGYALWLFLPLILWGLSDPPRSQMLYYYLIMGTGVLLLLAAFVVFVVWFVLQNMDMNRITGGRFLTFVWAILLIVPILNVLSLYKFADHIHQAQIVRGVTGMHPASLFILLWVAAFIGRPIAQAQMDRLEAVI